MLVVECFLFIYLNMALTLHLLAFSEISSHFQPLLEIFGDRFHMFLAVSKKWCWSSKLHGLFSCDRS